MSVYTVGAKMCSMGHMKDGCRIPYRDIFIELWLLLDP